MLGISQAVDVDDKRAIPAGPSGLGQEIVLRQLQRLAAADADAKLAALKETDSWKQDTFIEEGGWVTFANMEKPVDGAAELCASRLMAASPSATDSGA